jgi:hypothetical protein
LVKKLTNTLSQVGKRILGLDDKVGKLTHSDSNTGKKSSEKKNRIYRIYGIPLKGCACLNRLDEGEELLAKGIEKKIQ